MQIGTNKLKAGAATLLPDKVDFKTKVLIKDQEEHFIMITGSIQPEDITLVNINAPNTGAPKCTCKANINGFKRRD